MSDAYAAFVAGKGVAHVPAGFDAEPPPYLFPFQAAIVRWAMRRGRAAVFADCGLGKSPMLLAWSDAVARRAGRVLVLCPLAVAEQTVREAAKFGIGGVCYLREDDGKTRIAVANYEMLGHFDARRFAGVVIDECFAAGTLIDTPTGRQHIEDVREGDEIINASGVDLVSSIHRREVFYGVRITYGSGSCVASPSHPFFTQRGWVEAQTLRPGDHALASSAAVRLVRNGVCATLPGSIRPAVLRNVLLSEMADEATGDPCEGSFAGVGSEARAKAFGVAALRSPESHSATSAPRGPQPVQRSGHRREGLPTIEGDPPRSFRAWWQRPRDASPAEDFAGCTRRELGAGVCLITGPTDSGLSHELQARLGVAREAARCRGGWVQPPDTSGTRARREEGREAGFIGVEGVEILEPGHHELERLRSADGKLYFYDIGGTRHPSFSVNGALVHNSGILKSFDGATRNAIVGTFAATPYKLACTATPAPNDYTELGNHAEFLGVRTRIEMLAEYFVHDGGSTADWRIKGHAKEVFWRWVAEWACFVRSPSDLGFDDAGFELPPLTYHEHVVPVDHRAAWAAGTLFALDTKTLAEQRATRRATIGPRVALAAELARGDEPVLIWCELNDEGDAVADAIGADAVQVAGSDTLDDKASRMLGFAEGRHRVLVSKSKIAGFGMNWQHCARMVFVGASHSFEQTYQAIRRCWRFGQMRPVEVHTIRAETDGAVVANFRRKAEDVAKMGAELVALVGKDQLAGFASERWNSYRPTMAMRIPQWLVSEP